MEPYEATEQSVFRGALEYRLESFRDLGMMRPGPVEKEAFVVEEACPSFQKHSPNLVRKQDF